MKRKVAIVGGGKSQKNAPYKSKEYDIWTCNEMEPERYDVMYELHPMDVQNKRELEFLMNCEKPVYVLWETPLVPNGWVFPLDEILKQKWASPYFTCTFAYQIAHAIYLDYRTIELYGVNMDHGSPRERTVESACMQYWIGIAIGMGIKIFWDEHPAKYRLKYGYDYFEEKWEIENWLSRLALQTIYRTGPMHGSMGGDNLPIRKKGKLIDLIDYAKHKEDCQFDDFHECTCGLSDIIWEL